jgi:hypothetical protein
MEVIAANAIAAGKYKPKKQEVTEIWTPE